MIIQDGEFLTVVDERWPDGPRVRVIRDSFFVDTDGITRRLFTADVRHHRFVLAEFNTHRMMTRSSASSRAIPFPKMLAMFMDDPALPLSYASEKPGMSGGAELEGEDLANAISMLQEWNLQTATLLSYYVKAMKEQYGPDWKEHTLHKSVLNRLLEPQMWHRAIVSSTEFKNFFDQRSTIRTPHAQPEMGAPATLLEEAYCESTPTLLQPGEAHKPYIRPEDPIWAHDEALAAGECLLDAHGVPIVAEHYMRELSVARCARVSFLNHEGILDRASDFGLYERLSTQSPPHAAPLEHVATPAEWNVRKVEIVQRRRGSAVGSQIFTLPVIGNFVGFLQMRHEVLGL